MPNVDARLAILRVLFRRSPHDLSAITLQSIASRTHGFVGADLASLVHTASVNAIRRSLLPSSSTAVGDMRLSEADIEAALLVTRPSAMREVFIEAPKVRWSDVGGQEQVKRRLKESVEWPLRHPETFKRLGIRPPAGVLLYGPPGCSKTLIARALATEAGLNFIAIKGPEVRSLELLFVLGCYDTAHRSSTSMSGSQSERCAKSSAKRERLRRRFSSWCVLIRSLPSTAIRELHRTKWTRLPRHAMRATAPRRPIAY